MTKDEKEMHVSKYKRIYNQKEAAKFYGHIQHFLEHERNDDEDMAEVLDIMYQVLIGTINDEKEIYGQEIANEEIR